MLRTLQILRNHDLWSRLESCGSDFISLPAHVIFSMLVFLRRSTSQTAGQYGKPCYGPDGDIFLMAESVQVHVGQCRRDAFVSLYRRYIDTDVTGSDGKAP